jgi:uncharacterized protein (TIGR03086 family)
VPPDLDTLDRARAGFGEMLAGVSPDQWARPTPCEGWTVRDLVNHVVLGGRMTARLLHGASAEDVTALFGTDMLGDDPTTAFAGSSAEERDAFAEPGSLDRIVHHPGAGDVPGALLLGFRIGDHLLHTWDLARAVGADEALDPGAVETVWAVLEPMAPMIPSIGVFGTGPSGSVGEDAPLQTRLLDLSGRRP